MLAYKNFLNEAAKKYAGLKELTPEESKALKNCLLDIYKHVAHVCMAHNLVIMLGGGSCLGAVRHQGFIPWDDDMDLMMPRTDYEQLIELCEQGKLGNQCCNCSTAAGFAVTYSRLQTTRLACGDGRQGC